MRICINAAFFDDGPIRIGGPGLGRKESEKGILHLLEALIVINRMELRKEKYPKLYQAGVRYVAERAEEWKDVVHVFDDGVGDCEDLACWRIAELRNMGKRAEPYLRFRRVGNRMIYHVMVLRPGGLEDPSKVLGMKGID